MENSFSRSGFFARGRFRSVFMLNWWQNRAAACGLISPILLLAGVALVAWLQQVQEPWATTVSKMGRFGQPYSETMNFTLMISGCLVAAFAQGLPHSRQSGVLDARRMFVIFGLVGLGGAGLFPCDLDCGGWSIFNLLHSSVVITGALGLFLGLYKLPCAFENEADWGWLARGAQALAFLGFAAAFLFLMGLWRVIQPLEGYIGLIEKQYLLSVFMLIFLIAHRTARKTT